MILEYCDGGSLDRKFKRSGALALDVKVRLLGEVARGIAHLHKVRFGLHSCPEIFFLFPYLLE
jgi:serine/threonine protein kinase